MATESTTKLRFDILSEELKALHSLENWGTSLFLTAICLLSKQLVDWSVQAPPPPATSFTLTAHLLLLPAIIGLVAFVFLRAVNFRIRRAREHQYALAQASNNRTWRTWGLVGWLMALMPLTLGLGASWYFTASRPEISNLFTWLLWSAVIALFIAAVLFVRQSSRKFALPNGG